MLLLEASDTEQFTAATFDKVAFESLAKLNKIFTAASGAALNIRIIFSELAVVPLQILGQKSKFISVLEIVQEHRVRNDHVAVSLLTFCENAFLSFRLDLLLEIFFPGNSTELMTAGQRDCSHFRIIIVESVINYGTYAAIFGWE